MEVFTNWVAGSCSSAIPKIASSTQFSAPVPHLGQEMLSGLGGSLAACGFYLSFSAEEGGSHHRHGTAALVILRPIREA